MSKHPSHLLEPSIPARPLVLRVHVGRKVAIDLFANAALRWLCRAGFAPAMRIVGVSF